MPNIFRKKVKTLITLLKDDTSAQSLFSMIFEKACRDLNEINTNVLDELVVHLKQYANNAESEQKNRSQCDRFRDILFEIITNASKQNDNIDWLINVTLPAFILIVKAHVDANKNTTESDANSSNEIIKLMKMYLNQTVIACEYLHFE